MTAWALLLAAIAAAGGLRVETDTPAALCPDVGEVRRAVRERLGEIEGGGEWRATYALVHRPGAAGDVVRLQLRDPDGRLRLRRDLPRAGESCVAVAQALVLVLEGFFRHPTDATGERPGDAGPAPAGVPVAPVGGDAAESIARAPGGAATRPPGWGPAVDVSGGWSFGPSSPAIAVDLWFGGRFGAWAFGVGGAWLAAEQRGTVDFGAGTGTASLRTVIARAWVARRLRLGERLELLAGPELIVGIDRATIADVPGATNNVRAGFGAGARGQLRLQVATRVALSLFAAADFTPRAWAGTFQIENVPGQFFPAPRFRLLAGAGISVTLFR
jgi:hypothetical protein